VWESRTSGGGGRTRQIILVLRGHRECSFIRGDRPFVGADAPSPIAGNGPGHCKSHCGKFLRKLKKYSLETRVHAVQM